MNKKLVSSLIIFLLCIPVLARVFKGESELELTTEKVFKKDVFESSLASGKFTHTKMVQLRTEVTGKIEKIYVKQGDTVTAGQLLFDINDNDYLVETERLQANVRKAKISIDRTQLQIKKHQLKYDKYLPLSSKGALSKEAFDNIKIDLELVKNDLLTKKELYAESLVLLDQANENLKKTKIYSPINGVITELNIKEGEVVNGNSIYSHGAVVIGIADKDSFVARLYIDEANIRDIEIGQKVKIRSVAMQSEVLMGQVTFIDHVMAKDSPREGRNFAINVSLNGAEEMNLKEGMSCHAEIFTSLINDTMVVSLQSLQYNKLNNDKSTFVYTLKNGVVGKKEVSVGISDDSYISILSGLLLDDVIINGPQKLISDLDSGVRAVAKL